MIAEHMITIRGSDRGSFIAGPSTHNQRIERLWRDVFRVVLSTFYGFFYWLEETGHLDIENELHRFSLQYVFLPRINNSLEQFVSGWNLHPIRTEHNWTPNQIFLNSRISLGQDFHDEEIIEATYGRDWQGPIVDEEETVVEVEDLENPLSRENLQHLQRLIPDPMATCQDFGLQLYLICRNYVTSITEAQ